MRFKLEETIRVKRRYLDEDGNMPKYHMVYTVDGVKSEQDISAVNVQKAEELIRKQYSGQSVNFTSKQEVKDINEGIWDDIKSSANKRIAKHYANKAVNAYDKGNAEKGKKYLDKSVKSWDRTKEMQDTMSKAKEVGDEFKKGAQEAQSKIKQLRGQQQESLKEDIEDPMAVKEDAVEESEKVPQTSEAVGLSNAIIQEINGEWETIQHYNDLISLMGAQGYDSMVDVISDIVAEENTHIGQLQKCLQMISPNVDKIDDGETEASEQLGTKECINCMDASIVFDSDFIPDDDFGINSGFEAYL